VVDKKRKKIFKVTFIKRFKFDFSDGQAMYFGQTDPQTTF